MSTLEWSQDFECGVRAIDHEHREMIEIINDFFARMGDNSTDDQIVYFLGEVHRLIEHHFALEEKMMRDRDYANYSAHKADHDRLLDDIRDIMDDTQSAGVDSRSALAERLRAWFSDHFRTLDRDLHKLAGL